MFDPTAMILADKVTQRHVTSAGPKAPTEPGKAPRRPRSEAGRRRVAAMLRRLATRVEPQAVRHCQPVS